MNYVLVSLVGDSATQDTDAFACWFEQESPPVRAFHGPHPDHEAVEVAVRTTRVAIVFGHDGGGSIRASRTGDPWADPQQFATIFADARVWVYACDTCPAALRAAVDSFGGQACALGVRVFVGHCTDVAAPPDTPTWPSVREQARRALGRALRAFIRGENDVEELRYAALRARGRDALAAHFIEGAMSGLRVLS